MTRTRNVHDKTYTVWRADNGPEHTGRDVDASDPAEAAELAAEYDHRRRDGWEWSWPVVYHVRLCESDEVHVVSVEREMVPEFAAGEALPLPMPAAVHVLWGGRAVCEDIRLSGVPKDWPAEQTWIGLSDVGMGRRTLAEITCAHCARRTPGLLAAFEDIGVELKT